MLVVRCCLKARKEETDFDHVLKGSGGFVIESRGLLSCVYSWCIVSIFLVYSREYSIFLGSKRYLGIFSSIFYSGRRMYYYI